MGAVRCVSSCEWAWYCMGCERDCIVFLWMAFENVELGDLYYGRRWMEITELREEDT